MGGECLTLNASYMPVDIIGWQDAIRLWICDKAEVLATYENKILHTGHRFNKPEYGVNDNFISVNYDNSLDSWKTAMEMPAVIRLLEFVNPKKKVQFFQPFSRQNVYYRDHGRCQYCGRKLSKNEFTYDHVIPKAQGGSSCWQNIVCACVVCNTKKRNRTPEEANMKLLQKPYAPLLAENFNSGVISRLRKMSKLINNKQWQDYIYWSVEIKD